MLVMGAGDGKLWDRECRFIWGRSETCPYVGGDRVTGSTKSLWQEIQYGGSPVVDMHAHPSLKVSESC